MKKNISIKHKCTHCKIIFAIKLLDGEFDTDLEHLKCINCGSGLNIQELGEELRK